MESSPRARASSVPAAARIASSDRLFDAYRPPPGVPDEIFQASGQPRPEAEYLVDLLEEVGAEELRRRKQLADAAFLTHGITFSVYFEKSGSERIFPFDLIPRPIVAEEWRRVESGLAQRIHALNSFLGDVYGRGRILAEGRIPGEVVDSAHGYHPQLKGIRPPGGVYIHIAGIDLVRGANDELVVLEDNIRVPSGVSYVLENRAVMKRIYPKMFPAIGVRSVDEYPTRLRAALTSVAPKITDRPRIVVLTPGPFNSAYFEHTFLARRMGCELVQPQDLAVWGGRVYVRTTRGPEPVDVIYRRVDDDFLDPLVFRSDSLLGVPGLVDAYARGNVTLANALGNGVGDDKAIYAYVPEMIRFYLGEEPILGQVPTYLCLREDDCRYVLENLDKLVVKSVDEAGGYGMLMGPQASKKEIASFRERIKANPRKYIAQPLIQLSTCPTWTGEGVAPRRVDLRPYVVTGRSSWVLPGGLTRVALREGSYIVNSSQGGGSKDTWVLDGGDR
ncbi:MAG: circularly permuted type 2 ATP-grasp protein [Gemmatimonas sp.]|nr:circularly permuted type 2 ATP-grasp protein [Gemmatimonas sp.]